MSKEDFLIDSRVSHSQCQKAVEALHSHELKKKEKFEENQILPAKEQHIWLNVTVKQVAPTHKVKPLKIPIVHPLVDPRTTSVCLITKDPQREYKDLLESNNIKFISRVVGIEKLKGKFKPFEARRILLRENGMFLADQRVIPLLPKLLGSKWFEAKKQPIPVCLTRKDLKGELERAISSTYLNQNRGTCSSIKVGKMSQKPSQIVENIKTAIPAIAKAIPGGWDNIQSLHIKTNSSVSLPVWSCVLEVPETGVWHGIGQEGSTIREEGKVEKGGENEAKANNSNKSKSRKRSPRSEDEAEEEAPKKKAKPIDQAGKTKDKPKAGNQTLQAVSPISQKQKKPSIAMQPEDSISAKKDSAKLPTTVPTLPIHRRIDSSRKRDQKTSDPSKTPSASDAKSTMPQAEVDSKINKRKEASSMKGTTILPATAKVAKPTLAKEETKAKYSSASFEKKKRLITKAKGGKSVKDIFLGKKVAQG